MATILRVKRRNIDEPSDTLVIACKKQKTDNDNSTEKLDSDDMTAVVKLAGTVQNQDDVVKQIARTLNKEDLKTNYKHNPINITAKNRLLAKESSRENRYKVINCFRSLDTDAENFDERRTTVIDVEDSISCTTQHSSSEKDNEYVYDLYYTETDREMAPDNLFSIFMPNENLVFDNYRENSDDSDACESEDSNSESNWRNDYPDSECSNESVDEEDMRLAVQRIKIEDEESDLSDDNSDFVYTVDEADVDNFGYKYAVYKAKMEEKYKDSDSEGSDYSGVYISEVDDDEEKEESDDNN